MRTIEGKDNITKIKLCGMMRQEDIENAAELPVEYLLLDTYKKVGAYGLDISSGIEKDGCKDREKMLAVVDKLRRRK